MLCVIRRMTWVLAVLLAAQAPAAIAETLRLGPLHVVDMQTGEVRTGRLLVIGNGLIEAELAYDPGIARPDGGQPGRWINASGGYAIPGLAEMHAHVPSRSDGEQQVRNVLALYLANGITTIRGMLGEPWHLQLRAVLESGEWDGPRLVTSGPSFNGRTVTSPEQAAHRVREQADAGYDFLKIHPGLEADEYAAVAAAAAEADIPIAGHVPAAAGLDAAFSAGQRTIDHLDGYAQRMLQKDSPLAGTEPEFFGLNLGADLAPQRAAGLARATAQAGIWNVPTQSLLENIAGTRPVELLMQRPEMRYVSQERAAAWQRTVTGTRQRYSAAQREGLLLARRALLMALKEAGAGLLLGSDAPQVMNVPGFSIHEELAFLVDAGLTPLEALQTGTVNVADFFGDASRGTLAQGKAADLVVLAGNPVEDIGATRRVIGVLRAGQWYDRAWIQRRLETIAETGF